MNYDWQPYLNVIETTVTRRTRSIALAIVRTKGPENFDTANAHLLVEEMNENGTLAIWSVIGVIYERLFRRKGLFYALELLDYCVRHCGLRFLKHLRKHFLSAMTRLLKLTSLREQTLVGQLNTQMKKLYHFTKSISSSGEVVVPPPSEISDVILIRCQKKVLFLIKLWTEVFVQCRDKVPDLFKVYQTLQQKNVRFPPIENAQKYTPITSMDRPPLPDTGHTLTYADTGLDFRVGPHKESEKVAQIKAAVLRYRNPRTSSQEKEKCLTALTAGHGYLLTIIEQKIEQRYHLSGKQAAQNHERTLNDLLDVLIDVEDLLEDARPTVKSKVEPSISKPVIQVKRKVSREEDSDDVPYLAPPPHPASHKVAREDLLDFDTSSESAES